MDMRRIIYTNENAKDMIDNDMSKTKNRFGLAIHALGKKKQYH
jgi:hypothetical protein